MLHYIWIGGEKTDIVKKCESSYKEYLKSFIIMEWNESNIDYESFDQCLKDAYVSFYDRKYYAFCSDIARLYILLNNGGIYVDSDIEFIRPLNDKFLQTPLLGRGADGRVDNGIIWGCYKNDKFVKSCIRWFNKNMSILGSNSYGLNWIFSDIPRGFMDLFGDTHDNESITKFYDYTVYPSKYFDLEKAGAFSITLDHHAGSWRKCKRVELNTISGK